jgi:hypothetical protein
MEEELQLQEYDEGDEQGDSQDDEIGENDEDDEQENEEYDDQEDDAGLMGLYHEQLLTCNSETETCATLLSIFYGANLSQQAFETIVRFVNLTNKDGPQLPLSFDQIFQRFYKSLDKYDGTNPIKKYTKTYYCKIHGVTMLEHQKQRRCLQCENTNRLSMHYYFDIEYQIRKIIQKNIINFGKASRYSTDYICDLQDGAIYQDFLRTPQGQCVKDGNGFTLSINTDGVNPCMKSKMSLWPVFLAINEIPLDQRYCIENMIIAGKTFASIYLCCSFSSIIFFSIKGLATGDCKPDFETFIKPIVDSFKRLESSFEVENKNTSKRFRCFLLYGVYDKPARALANNVINSNGYFGCCKCLQRGSRLKNAKSKSFNIFCHR